MQADHSRPVVLLCVADTTVRQTLQRKLYGRALSRSIERASQLVREAELLELGALILDSACAAAGDDALPDHFALRFPHLPVMLADADPPFNCLDTLLADALARSAVGRTQAIIDDVTPPLDRLVVDFLLQAACVRREVGKVTRLARRIGSSVRTLEQHLSAARLPPAHVLFWTIMVLRAAILLQDPRCTLRRVSALLPFPDPAAVSVRFRRYAGTMTSEVRHQAALDELWQHFAQQLDGAALRIPLSSHERDRLRAAAGAKQQDDAEWARHAIVRALGRAEPSRNGAFAQRVAPLAIDRSA